MDSEARDALRWSDTAAAATTSDVLLLGAVPAVAMGGLALAAALEGEEDEIGPDSSLVAEAVVAVALATEGVKLVVARERPYVEGRDPSSPRSNEDHLSFFSGHTSVAVAFVVASGTVAAMGGRKLAPWIFAVGLPLALATGYLRIAADRHHLTDTLAGAGVGALGGFAIPFVFHPPLQ